jgi:mRNA-degrading endonuclease RelE of RelBE toxin-antitoxin system
LDAALAALAQEPEKETRNLKILRPNPIAKYELRVGNLRLFFEVDGVAREVMMLAIGRKDGNRLWIGGREVEL